MLANVNTQILAFWEEYERKSERDRDLFTESTRNKVAAFLDEPMIQHILVQTKTTINFRYIMDNSKILRIPRQSCHRFQVNPATDSTAKLPSVPHESCH